MSGRISSKQRGRELTAYIATVVIPFEGKACLIWPYFRNNRGFPRIGQKYVAPIVCEARNGPKPHRSSTIFYTCSNGAKGCVNGGHMRWGTVGEGRRGERNNHVKLTEDIVLWVLEQPHTMTTYDIGERIGISHQQVGRIRRGVTWRWLFRRWKAGKAK